MILLLAFRNKLPRLKVLSLRHIHSLNTDSYVGILRNCITSKDILQGKIIHGQLNHKGIQRSRVTRNTLLELYIKCGSITDADKVFDEMPDPDVCSWTLMISGYSRHGQPLKSLQLFSNMELSNVSPNHFTFSAVISACGSLGYFEEGIQIHQHVITRYGMQSNLSIINALVDMYGNCGKIEFARQVFDKMTERDVVSWTAMVGGYARNGCVAEALETFNEMPSKNNVSWVSLISGFADCGYLDQAMDAFSKMPNKNVVSWTAIISGFSKAGRGEEAIRQFQNMISGGIFPDANAFVMVLSICTTMLDFKQGLQFHGKLVKCGYQGNVFVSNVLMDLYAKCGYIDSARKLLDRIKHPDVVSWTTMIAGYAQHGQLDNALELFRMIPEKSVFTWNAIIGGLAQNGYVQEAMTLFVKLPFKSVSSWNSMIVGLGKEGHVDSAFRLFNQMPTREIDSWNSMIACFCHNGFVNEALDLFKEMPHQNAVSWNSMISGFAQNGHAHDALKLFRQMPYAGVCLDAMTFGCILPVCAKFAALEQGREIHEKIIRSGFHRDIVMGNALIDMYAKSGSIEEARHVFEMMHRRNAISWTVMIGGYALHGSAHEAISLFEKMKKWGIAPDKVTFTCILFACSHVGLVDEGFEYFKGMTDNYNITPTIDHYNCLVDLLGRAGRLDEAQNLISTMPVEPNAAVWSSFLSSCRLHDDLKAAEHAFEEILKFDNVSDAPYVLLSNVYAAAGKWDSIERLRKMMADRGVRKSPGGSWVEVMNQIHSFFVGEKRLG